MKNKLYLIFALAGLCAVKTGFSQSATNKAVPAIQLTDPNDNPKALPGLGEKVLTIFYTDPDVKDVNDELSNALKAKSFPLDKYSGIGIANCKDTWIPNAGIRMKSRQKEKQFPGSIILLDKDHIFPKALGLNDCNEAGVVVVIGKDKMVKFIKYVKTPEESKAIINNVIQIITAEIAK
jgi:uncharacterized protein